MRCSRARKQLSAYIDDELAARMRARVERHLAGCPECRRRTHDLSRLVQSVRTVATVEPSDEFRSATLRRIRAGVKVPRAAVPIRRRWMTALAACGAVVLAVAGWIVFSANRPEPDAIDRSMLVQVAFLDTLLSDESAEALSVFDETVLLPALENIRYEASPGAVTTPLVGESNGIEEMVETLSTAERAEFRTVLLDMAKEG
jgi:predicted anti-sigma-YlaC factor YlaD